MCSRFPWVWGAILALLIGIPGRVPAEEPEIGLALLITVDQLRGDMPARFEDRFGAGGFRYLMDRGAHYTHAYYQHASTFTAVGHATLFTGGRTAQHGLPANDWYDWRTGKQVYCVEDDRHQLLGEETEAGDGTSPRNLTASTVGDQLMLAGKGQSKVFSVSVKDRGAIIPGGFLGKAFWYSKKTGRFLTSTYYYPQMPPWVEQWNKTRGADKYRGQTWTLRREESHYQHADNRAVERPLPGLERQFPHALGDSADFYSRLRATPFADRMLMEFAKEVIAREQLGQRGATDVLAVSFSATDYIGHQFGPESREAEDNLIRLDETLAELFAYVDRQVGLDRTLIVLSADHGVDEIPEYKLGLNFPAGRVDVPGAIARANAALRSQLQCDEDLVLTFLTPSVYLNRELIEELALDPAEAERVAAAALGRVPGIARALRRSELERMPRAHDPILARAQRAFHPQRSGDILLIQEPFWYLHRDPEKYSAMHGSPHNYDAHVPILFAGPGIQPRRIHRQVAPADIAITLCTILNLPVPPSSVGHPLVEILH